MVALTDAGPPAPAADEQILLADGGGGERTAQLLRDHILPRFDNPALAPLTDAAVLNWSADRLVLTTDSYVVRPLEFPGGDIGRLAVCGTVNDLAVMGAEPVALSLGLILEEGLSLSLLDRLLDSAASAAAEAGVRIVTGDTKVIERRGDAGLYVNTAGVGRMRPGVSVGMERVRPGDALLVSGTLGDHGLAVLSVRHDIAFDSPLQSDVAPLAGMIAALFAGGIDVRFMRDATRGGVAGVLADLSERTGLSLEIDEAALPMTPAAAHAAAMLGLDPLTVANEGKVLLVVPAEQAKAACKRLHGHPFGRRAAVIGRVVERTPALVELLTESGGRRIVQRPYGEDQPRIC